MWDAKQYDQFAADRARPFFDLVGRVGAEKPQHVVDLGCGTGSTTASLAQRWLDAQVVGVDSSAEMLAKAQQHAIPERLTFAEADVTSWRPTAPVDVLVSNATLHWVPTHRELLPGFVSWLAPEGWLAFQVPGNFRAPAHRLLAELRTSPRWRDLVGAGADQHLVVAEPREYLATLAGLGCRVDAWETTYLHVLQGENPVLDWIKGTGMRPVLDALPQPQQAEFLAEYGALLRAEFPRQPWGTVLEFRRIFVVAQLL